MTDQRITWFSGERPVNGSGNTVYVKPDADPDRIQATPPSPPDEENDR